MNNNNNNGNNNKNENSKIKEKIKNTKKKLEGKQKKNSERTKPKDKNELMKEIQILKAQLKKKDQEINPATNKDNIIQDLKKKLNEEKAKTLKIINDLKTKNNMLSEKLTETGDEIQDKDKLNKEYEEKINELNMELININNREKKLNKIKVDNGCQCNIEESKTRSKGDTNELKKQLTEKDQIINRLTLDNEKLAIKLDMERRKLSLLNTEEDNQEILNESTDSLRDMEDKVKLLQAELNKQTAENDKIMKDIQRASNKRIFR